MTTHITLLLEQFDHLLTTPAAVEELNRTILTLAVQGKLVEQDPQDEPASELLKRIAAQRDPKGLSRPLGSVREDEKPFELPKGWEWVRLPEVTFNWGQKKPDKPFSYIDVSSIDNLAGKIGDEFVIIEPENAPSRARKIVKKGSVIYSTVRPYLLNIAIIDRDIQPELIVSTAFYVMQPIDELDARFLHLCLRSNYFTQFVESEMIGMAYPAISDGKMSQGIIPLPPPAEQKRIVARVETLFAQTRQLAEKLARAQHDLTLLNQSALAHLLAATSEHPEPVEGGALRQAQRAGQAELSLPKLVEAWAFIAQHFESLFTEMEHIAPLRQAILELAVRGKLTRRESTDEPASALLARIQAEKAKAGKAESLPPVKASEQPFSLPEGWEWVRLEHLAPEFQNGIGRRESASSGKEIIVLRLADVGSGTIALGNTRSIVLLEEEIKRYALKSNDILITRVNGSIDLIGSFTLINQGVFYSYCDHFIRMRLLPNTIEPTYLAKIAKSEFVRSQIRAKFITTAGQKTVNQRHISSLLFPLPPLAEQQRIVAKVEQLLGRCDALEAKLRSAREARVRLTAAVLAGVGGGESRGQREGERRMPADSTPA